MCTVANSPTAFGLQATGVDVEGKKVNFSDGEAVSYDTLLLATGSK